MSGTPATIRTARLLELLAASVNVDVTAAAIADLRLATSDELSVGSSTAGSFVNLMRRKLKSATDAGHVFIGWPQLEECLLALDPATAILGVAIRNGGSVVMTADLEVLGALVRVDNLTDKEGGSDVGDPG